MDKAKVYYTSFKTSWRENLIQKLERLCVTAGMKEIDFKDKYVAIKLHFGEYGNLAFLRPNYAKVVADIVKECGGKPFLTDCNTLYVGSRKNALDHLDTAYVNGFSPLTTGCQVIIADGLKGLDETLVPINGEYVKEAKIGQAVMDADVFISLTHFKGHEMAGFGGTLKNIGMGCGSRAGKMEMHSEGKPFIRAEECIGCGACARICAHEGPVLENGKARIDHNRCVGCGRCIAACPKDAVKAAYGSPNDVLNCKIAEYSLAVCQNRPCFHISLICDVSPNCDCHAENDIPIIPNVGMLASFDPVALDQACADLCNSQPAMGGSVLHDHLHKCGHTHADEYNCEEEACQEDSHIHGAAHGDHFRRVHPDTNWKSCVAHGEKIGLGTKEYELIEI